MNHMTIEVLRTSKMMVWQNLQKTICKTVVLLGILCIHEPKPTVPWVSEI